MARSDVRPAAVAGRFYPDDPGELREFVEHLVGEVAAKPLPAVAAMAPHAGLVYSGQCAAHVFQRITLPPVVVILAPNHTGRSGAPGGASTWSGGAFATPLGQVQIASDLARQLERSCPLVEHDLLAHRREHAVEVELPFLQVLAPDAAIVPLVLAWDDWPRCKTLADALAQAVSDSADDVLILASSDMTHYESAQQAAAKDEQALTAVRKLDGEALLRTCRTKGVTMCGRAPTAVALEAARLLGATTADVVDYRHSGWVTGDDSSVVGYAGVVVR